MMSFSTQGMIMLISTVNYLSKCCLIYMFRDAHGSIVGNTLTFPYLRSQVLSVVEKLVLVCQCYMIFRADSWSYSMFYFPPTPHLLTFIYNVQCTSTMNTLATLTTLTGLQANYAALNDHVYPRHDHSS